MTHRLDVARGRDIVARWCSLAEQRLEYLTELFETGRWRRFHSERDFLENIQEAKAAVETWRDLLSREASRNNTAIDVSWLGRARTALPRDEGWRGPVRLRQPALAEIRSNTIAGIQSFCRYPTRLVRRMRFPRRRSATRAARLTPGSRSRNAIRCCATRCRDYYRRTALVPTTTWAKRCAPSADRSGVMGRA